MSSKDTFKKAYGNFNKEVTSASNWDWIPTKRGFTFYYLKLIRFLTR